jgi:hypothetical protein
MERSITLLEGGECIASNAELQAAIAEAQRHPTVGFGWASPPCGFMTNPAELQRYRARKKASDSVAHRETIDHQRAAVPVRHDGGPALVPVAAEAPTALARLPESTRVGGVSVQLDVAVERRRLWFWRLALHFVVRRLR